MIQFTTPVLIVLGCSVFFVVLITLLIVYILSNENPKPYITPSLSLVNNPHEHYSWLSNTWTDWSSCIEDEQHRTRTVNCVDLSDDPVVDNKCKIDDKPEVTETQICKSYNWYIGDWTNWSACIFDVETKSDKETKTRDVHCVNIENMHIDDSFCFPDPKPDSKEKNDCVVQYHWYIGAWRDCSDCTDEEQHCTRPVICINGDDTTFPDSYCAEVTKPDSAKTQSC
jgi:hypothetical protein